MEIITSLIAEGIDNYISGKNSGEFINPNPEALFLLKQAELERLARKDIAELSKSQAEKKTLAEKIRCSLKGFIDTLKTRIKRV